MTTIDILGIDIAKNVFKRRVMRDQFLGVLGVLEPCKIAIEVCTGAFCWARKFEHLGHRVKIVSPRYVKPFVRGQRPSAPPFAGRTSRSSRSAPSSSRISRRSTARGRGL